jgi:hypothetical protein
MKRHLIGWRIALGVVGLATPAAFADIPYFNGFETANSINDFFNPASQPGVGITQVASGGGTLHYTAASGNDYAEIQNTDDPHSGLGIAGGTLYGSTVSTHSVNGFQESIDIYVDTALWLPQNTNGSNFVVSTRPTTTSGAAPSGTADDFVNFIFTVNTAGSIAVSSSASPALTTITTSGWYQFVTTFVPGTQFVTNDVSVLDAQGNLMGTTGHQVSTLPSASLGGSGLTLFSPWRNGFAGDVIAIDNLETNALPEPMTLGLLPIGLALLRRRSRR